MKTYLPLILMMTVMTSAVLAKDAETSPLDLEIIESRVYLASGEVTKARSKTEDLMLRYPGNEKVRNLMSEVIDREIAEEKEPETPSKDASIESTPALSAQQKQIEIDRWLERAKTLASYHQFDQAVLAAEKVFQLDPENVRASRLIDQIQGKALKEGTSDMKAIKKSAKQEAKGRVQQYLAQAREWSESGSFGAARLACDKVLILDPDNDEAQSIKKQIRKHLENEAGKTL